MKQYQFETERLLIRNYCRKDVDEFIRVAEQPEVYVTTCGIPHEYPRRMAKKWLSYVKNCINSGISYEFAVILKENGTYIGNVGLINLDRMHNHAEISYYTDRAYRCLGLTTEAASEMLRFGFSALGLHKISGLYMSRNPASGRVMEKLGMKIEGLLREELLKDGKYYDLMRRSILYEEYITESKSAKPGEFSTLSS